MVKTEAIVCAEDPLNRTTPIPPRPGGVAMATMVSWVENTVNGELDSPITRFCYFRNEIRTVFENASPTLSVVTPGISATVKCTMRRSYGLSGPSC